MSRLRRARRIRDFALWTTAIVVFAVLIPFFDDVDRGIRKPLFVALTVVALVPIFAYQVFRAPEFDMHVKHRTVDYEFADTEYAREFYELNAENGAQPPE